MTIEEAGIKILAETKSITWAEASPALQLLVIRGLIEQVVAEPQAAKPPKQRKKREKKPLTQPAGANHQSGPSDAA